MSVPFVPEELLKKPPLSLVSLGPGRDDFVFWVEIVINPVV